MTIQVRYPKVITQEENSSKSEWNDLDNVKIDDWDEFLGGIQRDKAIYDFISTLSL